MCEFEVIEFVVVGLDEGSRISMQGSMVLPIDGQHALLVRG